MKKHSYIMRGKPPVILAPYDEAEEHSQFPLYSLISQLYSLVQQHYATLALSKLTRFKVRLAVNLPQREEARSEPFAVKLAPDVSALYERRKQKEQSSTTPRIQPSTSAADAISAPRQARGFLTRMATFSLSSPTPSRWRESNGLSSP